MKLKIALDLNNAAFCGTYQDTIAEATRAIDATLRKMYETGGADASIRDINGNTVGKIQIFV